MSGRLRAAMTPRPIHFRRLSARRAFTLVEVLVAVAILATGVVLVLRAFSIAIVGLDRSRNSLWAHMVMRDRFSEVTMSLRGGTDPGTGTVNGRTENPGGVFLWDRTVRDAAAGSSGGERGLKEVTVRVRREGSSDTWSGTTLRLLRHPAASDGGKQEAR